MSHRSKMKSLLGRTRAGPYADTKTTHSEAIWQMGQTVREDSEQNWAQQVFRPWWPHPGPAGNNKNLIFPIPCPLLLPLLTASLKPWLQDLNLWICPSSTSFCPLFLHMPLTHCSVFIPSPNRQRGSVHYIFITAINSQLVRHSLWHACTGPLFKRKE